MDQADVLLDQQDPDPLPAEPHQQCGEFVDDHGSKALARLVQDQQFGIGDQRAADGEHLLLAAAQRHAGIAATLRQDRKQFIEPLERPWPAAAHRGPQQ